ncbi:MAG: hypothetical protein WCR55_04180 [Lentisphaerota bacterium]
MIRKFLKILSITIAAIILLLCFLGAAIYIKYRTVTNANAPVQFVKSAIIPSDETPLGEVVQAVITIKSPWNKTPITSEAKSANGSQLIGKAQFVKVNNSWGFCTWNIIQKLQSYTVGIIPEGEFHVSFSPDKDGKKDILDLKIPEFTSLEIKNVTDKPIVASKEEIKSITQSKAFYYVCSGIVLLIIIVVLWFIFRKKKAQIRILTPWERAILALNELKIEFLRGEITPIKCLFKLTDAVRFYLEERFDIHAPKQTTEEFMTGMENSSSPLTNQDRNFLREFMLSADMIKFAKYDADMSMIETSIERALLLIAETTPVQDANKVEAKE